MLKAPILPTDEIPAPPALVRLGSDKLQACIGVCNEFTGVRFIHYSPRIRNLTCVALYPIRALPISTIGLRPQARNPRRLVSSRSPLQTCRV
jgi:hypothetical protein